MKITDKMVEDYQKQLSICIFNHEFIKKHGYCFYRSHLSDFKFSVEIIFNGIINGLKPFSLFADAYLRGKLDGDYILKYFKEYVAEFHNCELPDSCINEIFAHVNERIDSKISALESDIRTLENSRPTN